jgi:ferritin-like metal-binding protein YciE
MSAKTYEDFFLHGLKTLYFAEQQALEMFPSFSKVAQSPALRHALDVHMRESREQVGRLEQIFDLMDEKPVGIQGDAIQGILGEVRQTIDLFKGSEAVETALIASLQMIEHYEITRYNALSALADQLGLEEAAELLEQSLEEEQDTDELLSDLADEAVSEEDEDEFEDEDEV